MRGGWFFVMFTVIVTFLSGCASLKREGADLDKQIERQQKMYQLSEEPQEREILSPKEYETIGDRHLKGNDINRAYLNYVKALAIEPENAGLLHKQAKLLTKKGKHSEAEKVYRKLLSISADDALAYEGLGRALLGQNNIAEAEDNFHAALVMNEALWQSHHFLALIMSSRQDYDGALFEFKLALSYKPQDITLLNNMAMTYYLQGHYEKAATILRTLARHSNEKKIYNNLALVSIRLGQYQEALDAFKKGTGSEASAYNNIGIEYLLDQKYEAAIASFEKAIALNPQFYPSANANLAQARKALQQRTGMQPAETQQ